MRCSICTLSGCWLPTKPDDSHRVSLTRRQAIRRLGLASASFPFLNLGRFQLFADEPRRYSAHCIDLVQRSLVIDMLSQFKLGAFPDVVPDPNPPTARWWSHPETFIAADLARYRESSINVFQIGWGAGKSDPHAGAVKVLNAWGGFIDHFHKDFARVLSVADIDALKPAQKIGILLGFQGSDHFEKLDDISFFYGLGQRLSQLTYNDHNAIGSGYEVTDSGLTGYGREVVGRMNQVGMAIDLSHCGPRTTLQTCELSRRPVLFTHANCLALNPHPRNKSDLLIKKMAATGGVMGISGVRQLVSRREPVTVENVIDHFDHVARLVGIEHVGLGSDIDLDGYDKLPPSLRAKMLTGYGHHANMRGDIEGLNHPKRVFDLTEGLIRRRYSDAHVELVLGANFRRALAAIWQ